MRNSVSKLWGFAMRCQSVFVASLKQHVINYHEIVFLFDDQVLVAVCIALDPANIYPVNWRFGRLLWAWFLRSMLAGGDYYKYCCTMTMLHYFQSRVFVAAPSIPRGFMRIPPVVSDDALGVESTSCRARWLANRGWCKRLQTRTGWSSF